MNQKIISALLATSAIALAVHVRADEGMWTFDNIPAPRLKQRYDFVATPQWLEHVRLSSVRFNDGGSGAFVSPNGLVVTNHHVALGQLAKVSTEKNDYIKNGFYARKPEEELKCPDLELNVLISMENVTDRVLGAVRPGDGDKEQNEERKAAMAGIEKESTDKTGLRSNVIELYQGGEYWLYRYKKYTDVRLVMAPEQQAAFFGGDPDNFTYPRFDLDFAFFRAYENGSPVSSTNYFKWSKSGAKEDELVFVPGNPGSTDRLKTVSQLKFERDIYLPLRLKMLTERRKALNTYATLGPEQARRAKDLVFGMDNGIKALAGELEGLRAPKLLANKEEQEKSLSAKLPDAFVNIASAQKRLAARQDQREFRGLVGSELGGFAMTIILEMAEVKKSNDKRFEEFRDSALESLNFRLFSPAPVYNDMEETMLADVLQEAHDELGDADPWVRAALQGRSPKEEAHALVSATKLADPEVRRSLIQGGVKGVRASKDPMISWALGLEPSYRELREWYEDRVQSVETAEGNRIAKARFALYGKLVYPDATFTLRLSFGKVAGYNQRTTQVPYKTTFYGLFDRSASFDGRSPFGIPVSMAQAREKFDLSVPLDIATTNDITGGNSGSPLINRDAECVGVIFDGNIQSLVWNSAYSDEQGRAIAVHSAAISEALRKIYGMDALAEELVGR